MKIILVVQGIFGILLPSYGGIFHNHYKNPTSVGIKWQQQLVGGRGVVWVMENWDPADGCIAVETRHVCCWDASCCGCAILRTPEHLAWKQKLSYSFMMKFQFHQVFSSEFPLYGMLLLFHKGTSFFRKKRELRVLSVYGKRTWRQFSDVWKAFVCRLGCLDFWEGTKFFWEESEDLSSGRSAKRWEFCVFDPKSHHFSSQNKTFELHYCLWSNHRKGCPPAPLISTEETPRLLRRR